MDKTRAGYRATITLVLTERCPICGEPFTFRYFEDCRKPKPMAAYSEPNAVDDNGNPIKLRVSDRPEADRDG